MLLSLLTFITLSLPAHAVKLVLVEAGNYKPILGQGKIVAVKAFYIDETAVTNKDYLAFVQKRPPWQKAEVPAIFADTNYLKHWRGRLKIGDKSLFDSPVVNVSWFAAQAYCESQGKRLPSVDEWEYLAQYGAADAKGDVQSVILEWYSKANEKKMPHVKSTFANKFGVWDVHGLVWEWNYDFNSSFVTGESRGDSALEKSMFCGAGALGAADPRDYATFMRFGFRSSLNAKYTLENLGFRCARDESK